MAQNNLNGIKSVPATGTPLNEDSESKRIFHWKCYHHYFRTFPAMVKLCELFCILIAFIISCLDKKFLLVGGSWLTLTNGLSFIVTSFFVIFHFFLLHRFIAAPWCVIELAAYVVMCVLVFSNGVLSAAYSHLGGLIIAETRLETSVEIPTYPIEVLNTGLQLHMGIMIFIFMALAVYMVDGLVTFKIFTAGKYYE